MQKRLEKEKIDIRTLRHFLNNFADKIIQKLEEEENAFNILTTKKISHTTKNFLDEEKQTVEMQEAENKKPLLQTIKSEISETKNLLDTELDYIKEDDSLKNRLDYAVFKFLGLINQSEDLKNSFRENEVCNNFTSLPNQYQHLQENFNINFQDDLFLNSQSENYKEEDNIKFKRELLKTYLKVLMSEDSEKEIKTKMKMNELFKEFLIYKTEKIENKITDTHRIKIDLEKVLKIYPNKFVDKMTPDDFFVIKERLKEFPKGDRRVDKLLENVKTYSDLKELNEKEELEKISANTINKVINALKQVFDYALKRGYIQKQILFVDELNLKVNRIKTDTEKWSEENLKILFGNLIWLQEIEKTILNNANQLFILFIGMFTGARVSEIAQLYLQDITETEDGFLILKMIVDEDEEDKSLKNKYSFRTVVLNKIVVEKLGFKLHLEAVKRIAKMQRKEDINIFGIQKRKNEIGEKKYVYGTKFSNSFSKQKNLIITDKKRELTFHSFRQNIAVFLAEKQYRFRVIASITGHKVLNFMNDQEEQGGLNSILNKVYLKGVNFFEEKKEIATLNPYPFLEKDFEKIGAEILKTYTKILTDKNIFEQFKRNNFNTK